MSVIKIIRNIIPWCWFETWPFKGRCYIIFFLKLIWLLGDQLAPLCCPFLGSLKHTIRCVSCVCVCKYITFAMVLPSSHHCKSVRMFERCWMVQSAIIWGFRNWKLHMQNGMRLFGLLRCAFFLKWIFKYLSVVSLSNGKSQVS